LKILVCEDQDAIRSMIETLVSASGHEVKAVPSGSLAVEQALSGNYDVLLLDLMLPGQMDGFEVATRLRADEKTRRLPIFVISAMDDPESQDRAKRLGVDKFYGKPFSPVSLLKGLDEVASGKGTKKKP
jgi:CheY-like chemotaxis protein